MLVLAFFSIVVASRVDADRFMNRDIVKCSRTQPCTSCSIRNEKCVWLDGAVPNILYVPSSTFSSCY